MFVFKNALSFVIVYSKEKHKKALNSKISTYILQIINIHTYSGYEFNSNNLFNILVLTLNNLSNSIHSIYCSDWKLF